MVRDTRQCISSVAPTAFLIIVALVGLPVTVSHSIDHQVTETRMAEKDGDLHCDADLGGINHPKG